MDVLKSLIVICFVACTACATLPQGVPADPNEPAPDPELSVEKAQIPLEKIEAVIQADEEAPPLTCPAADEYFAAYEFLRDYKKVQFDSLRARHLAAKISAHCAGATQRFRETFTLLVDLGVGFRPSLEIALKMTEQTTATQRAFTSILKSSYLTEYLDFNFKKAINLAYKFSLYSQGNPDAVRSDFARLAGFCKDQQKLGLNLNICSEYSIELAKLSPFYKYGLYDSFKSLFDELRGTREFGLGVQDSLKVAYDVLAYGPLAVENFKKSFIYAQREFSYPAKEALKFALAMAGRSLNQLHPLVNHPRYAGIIRVPETPGAPLKMDEILPGEEPREPEARGPANQDEE